MLQPAQRLCLDLADAFTRNVELLTYLFQRVIGVHSYAEAHAQHPFLTRRQGIEHTCDRLLEVGLDLWSVQVINFGEGGMLGLVELDWFAEGSAQSREHASGHSDVRPHFLV